MYNQTKVPIVIVHPCPAQKHSFPCTLHSEIRKIGQYNEILHPFKTVQCRNAKITGYASLRIQKWLANLHSASDMECDN